MESSRKRCLRILRRKGILLPLLGVGLGGCIFGDNQQFFSERVSAGSARPAGNLLGDPQSGTPAPVPDATPVVQPTPSQTLKTDLFKVSAPGAARIDVLFCVDNSLSMSDNQSILADSFAGFIRGFYSAGLDFHVGIISSDVDSSREDYWRTRMPDYPGANRGLLLSRNPAEHFLSPDTRDLVLKFEGNVRVGTRGSSREQCLASFIQALGKSTGPDSAWNSGFFRRDSFHSFVVVSDENEDIQDGESLESRVGRLRTAVSAISGPGSRGVRYDFIINLSARAPSSTPAPGAVQYYPARYLAASNLLTGHNHDISRNFSSDLLAISEGLVRQALQEFTLSGLPSDPAVMRVSLDGRRIEADYRNGYVYHAERNSIELTGAVAVGAIGKQLSVAYLEQTK